MFNGLSILPSMLLAGSLALASAPVESVQKQSMTPSNMEERVASENNQNETGKSGTWKTAPSEAELGPNEQVQGQQPENAGEEQQNQQVKLTEKQIKELDQMVGELTEKRKELIDKYVEFGVFPKEKAEEIKSHIDEHYKRMKEENFLPSPHKHTRKNVPPKEGGQ